MKKLLIKNGAIVLEDKVMQGDLLINGSVIEKIDEHINAGAAAEIHDASGKYIFPGIIDAHTHFELKAYGSRSGDDFYTGSSAAAAGGVTTFIDFAIPEKNQTMAEAVREKKRAASEKSIVDYSFHAQMIEWTKNSPAELAEVSEEGITSVKVFMPQTEGWGVGDGGLHRLLVYCAANRLLTMVHAENGDIALLLTKDLVAEGKTAVENYPDARPGFIEAEAALRAAYIARNAGTYIYICHISSAETVKEMARLKRDGERIITETCPQYLILDREKLAGRKGYLYACCPPLKNKEDNYGLWRGLIEDTIDLISTDHCPFSSKSKELKKNDFTRITNGLPGIEHLLQNMYTHGVLKRSMDIVQIIQKLSSAPAKVFGLYPKKGVLLEGSDADIVIYDPDRRVKVQASRQFTNCDWSPYEGNTLSGEISETYSRGELVFAGGKILGTKGRGIFLKREHLSLP